MSKELVFKSTGKKAYKLSDFGFGFDGFGYEVDYLCEMDEYAQTAPYAKNEYLSYEVSGRLYIEFLVTPPSRKLFIFVILKKRQN